MSKAFICYANKNDGFVRLAEMMLKEAGYEVWVDGQEVRVGEEWRKAIDEGIAASDVLLVVITPESCKSEYVTYEWAYALGKGIKVIPLLLEKADVHPRLAVLQHLDFTNRKGMPWPRLFQEIDTAQSAAEPKTPSDRVGDMTADQLQAMIAGAVSLATATAKSGRPVAAPEEISRNARSFVDVMQQAEQTARVSGSVTPKHILWVDDHPDNNIYERDAFESMGFAFTLALSTHEALQILSQKRFAGIISDMGRCEGPREGYVLLEKLRIACNETPFFIYAGSDSAEHKREAAARGAQGSTNNPQELFVLVTSTITRDAAPHDS
ncbi:TIR domain-containing protein [Pirellulales bacterium]|nr:TIR domain-containing protein [Pirellulales bacterium]